MNDLEAFALVAILLGLIVVVGMSMGGPMKSSQPIDYYQIARQDAARAGIDPNLFERQINQESGFNPNAISQAGAIGIAQIMPSTAGGWKVNPHDPVASLSAAAKAMAWYVNHYGNYDKALACYNAGCGALDIALAQCGTSWRLCSC